MSTDTSSRAAEVLGVPVEATAEAAANAFLAGLPVTDFVPPGKSVAALNTLVGLAVPVDADSDSPTLREEVEEFARRYWSFVPEDRLAAWLALNARSPNDSTANRLLTLQAGLKLPGTPFPDSPAEQIVAIARELYVMLPRERAIRRNEWLLANSARHKELIAIAATIQKNQAVFAALDPILFARLSPKFDARVFASGATASPLPERLQNRSEPIISPIPTPRPTPPETQHSEGLGWTSIIYIIGVVAGLARVLSMSLSSSSSTPEPLPSNLHLPDYPSVSDVYKKGSSLPNTSGFTQSQLDACLEFEKRGKKGPLPPRYAEWLYADKPETLEPTGKKQPKGSGRSSGASSTQPQQDVKYSAESVRKFYEYSVNPTGPLPPGFREWLEAGRPNASE